MVAHPGGEVGIVEVVLLHEGDCGLRGLYLLRFIDYLLDHVGGVVDNLVVLAHDNVGRAHHGQAHYQAETYLADNLEFAAHAVLVVALHLEVVVGEAQSAEPHGGHQHQNHVDVGEVAHQQAGEHRGHYYYDATHGGGAGFLHLPLEVEVAHNLSYLHPLQPVDNLASEHHGDEQRHEQGHSGAEGEVVHQSRAGDVGVL